MFKLRISLLVFALAVYTTNGLGWQPGGSLCGCFNPVYIEKPKNMTECSPKTKFLNQIFQNFNNVNFALLLNGSPLGCDLAKYRSKINEMKERTLQMVLAYFTCNVADCTSAIFEAYDNFVDYSKFEFVPYTRCALANFNQNCAQVLIQNRAPILASADNILITLLTCAKLKAEAHTGKVQILTPPLPLHQDRYTGCNCIKIDPSPIPKDECECFSPKYIATLRSFVEVNFGRIFGEYNLINHNSSCGFMELIGFTDQIRQITLSMIKLLEKASPQFIEFDEYLKEFTDLLPTYSEVEKSYILRKDKLCYYTARKARQSPISIAESVIGVLTKCVGYRVLGDERCSGYLK